MLTCQLVDVRAASDHPLHVWVTPETPFTDADGVSHAVTTYPNGIRFDYVDNALPVTAVVPQSDDPGNSVAQVLYTIRQVFGAGGGETWTGVALTQAQVTLEGLAPAGTTPPITIPTAVTAVAVSGTEHDPDSAGLVDLGDLATAQALGTEVTRATGVEQTLTTALTGKADLLNGKVVSSQIPDITITNTYSPVASQAEMLALPAHKGDLAVRTDTGRTFVLAADPATVLGNWVQLPAGGDVASVNGQTGVVNLGPADVGADPAGAALALAPGKARVATSAKASSLTGNGGLGLGTLPLADDVQLNAGDTLLLLNQATKNQNGPWVVGTGAWTRPVWFAAGSTQGGVSIGVAEGTVNGGQVYTLQGTIVVGTSSKSPWRASAIKVFRLLEDYAVDPTGTQDSSGRVNQAVADALTYLSTSTAVGAKILAPIGRLKMDAPVAPWTFGLPLDFEGAGDRTTQFLVSSAFETTYPGQPLFTVQGTGTNDGGMTLLDAPGTNTGKVFPWATDGTGLRVYTVASGSDGQALNALTGGVLSLSTTVGLPTSGQLSVWTSTGARLLTYTGVSGATLTGCASSSTGIVNTGNAAVQTPGVATGTGGRFWTWGTRTGLSAGAPQSQTGVQSAWLKITTQNLAIVGTGRVTLTWEGADDPFFTTNKTDEHSALIDVTAGTVTAITNGDTSTVLGSTTSVSMGSSANITGTAQHQCARLRVDVPSAVSSFLAKVTTSQQGSAPQMCTGGSFRNFQINVSGTPNTTVTATVTAFSNVVTAAAGTFFAYWLDNTVQNVAADGSVWPASTYITSVASDGSSITLSAPALAPDTQILVAPDGQRNFIGILLDRAKQCRLDNIVINKALKGGIVGVSVWDYLWSNVHIFKSGGPAPSRIRPLSGDTGSPAYVLDSDNDFSSSASSNASTMVQVHSEDNKWTQLYVGRRGHELRWFGPKWHGDLNNVNVMSLQPHVRFSSAYNCKIFGAQFSRTGRGHTSYELNPLEALDPFINNGEIKRSQFILVSGAHYGQTGQAPGASKDNSASVQLPGAEHCRWVNCQFDSNWGLFITSGDSAGNTFDESCVLLDNAYRWFYGATYTAGSASMTLPASSPLNPVDLVSTKKIYGPGFESGLIYASAQVLNPNGTYTVTLSGGTPTVSATNQPLALGWSGFGAPVVGNASSYTTGAGIGGIYKDPITGRRYDVKGTATTPAITEISSGLYRPTNIAAFSASGILTTRAGANRYYVEENTVIASARASVGSAPAGSSILVDVNKNGTTIFTTQANRPAIASAGNTSGLVTNPDVTTMVAGDYLTVDIDQIGSTTPGSDLVVEVRLQRV